MNHIYRIVWNTATACCQSVIRRNAASLSITPKFPLYSILVAVQLVMLTPAFAQQVSLKSGESADLQQVYWIADCKSELESFAGIDLLDGPPGVTLSIREEAVLPRRQNCPSKVAGGVVVASVKDVPTEIAGVLKYRVRYKTLDGPRQSSHSTQISLFP